jgi:hypothetical protein
VKASTSGPAPLQLGSTFSMDMKQPGASYSMVNEVTELETDRRVAWRPWFEVRGRRVLGGVTWRYEISPTNGGCTVVETYDVTTGRASHVFALLRFPEKQAKAMAATLDRLAALAERVAAG